MKVKQAYRTVWTKQIYRNGTVMPGKMGEKKVLHTVNTLVMEVSQPED